MKPEQAIAKIKSLGYPDVWPLGDGYYYGSRQKEKKQWFKVSKRKLYRRMDIHAGKFEWEVVK